MKLSELIHKMSNNENVRISGKNPSFQVDTYYLNNKLYGYEIILRITAKCNINCNYCFVDHDKKEYTDKQFEKIIDGITSIELNTSTIVLSGGEPTIKKNFLKYIQKLVASKTRLIQIQTNAILFSIDDFFNRLPVDSRINLMVSFPSKDESIYNKITQSKLYHKAMKGIEKLSRRYETKLNFVVVKSNYNELPSLPEFVSEHFDRRRIIIGIANLGTQERLDAEKHLVRYSELIPLFRKAISNAKKYKVRLKLNVGGGCGFPCCILEKIDSKIMSRSVAKAYTDEIEYNGFSKQFYKSSLCKKCKYNEYCNGFPRKYVLKFGEKEIQPII